MIKYIILPTKILQTNMKASSLLVFGALSVLTKKGERHTNVSNLYLAKLVNKSTSQISLALKDLKTKKVIYIGRNLGRRTIEMNKDGLIKAGIYQKESKNVRKN